jgi:hypothetical protein
MVSPSFPDELDTPGCEESDEEHEGGNGPFGNIVGLPEQHFHYFVTVAMLSIRLDICTSWEV